MIFILYILLLLAVVMIHELGHMLVAKAFGVYCHEFSFGMGPKLFSFKGKETEYSFRAIPLGGFVAMAGDGDENYTEGKDLVIPEERKITGIKGWKKLLIYSAGIIMNLLLAILIFSMVFLSYKQVSVSPEATIGTVEASSPAEKAGLKEGDKITDITLPDGEKFAVDSFSALSTYMSLYEGEGEVIYTVIRDNEELDISIIPSYLEEEERYIIGITSSEYEIAEVNFLNCWKYGFDYCISNATMVFSALGNLIHGKGLNNVSGVIGMYETTGQVVEMGMDVYFLFCGVISLNLGIMNALPIAMLDGGKILIEIIQMIIRKPLNSKVVNYIMTASVFLLIALWVLVMIKDIVNLF